jgi:hypothetical protein
MSATPQNTTNMNDKIESDIKEVVAHVEQTDKRLDRADAIQAEPAEHHLTLRQSLKTYRRAILWSMAISLVIVMDGYDTGRECGPSKDQTCADI